MTWNERESPFHVAPGCGCGRSRCCRLPSGTGTPVTSVSVKGEAGRIAHYPAILQRVIERAAALKAM